MYVSYSLGLFWVEMIQFKFKTVFIVLFGIYNLEAAKEAEYDIDISSPIFTLLSVLLSTNPRGKYLAL